MGPDNTNGEELSVVEATEADRPWVHRLLEKQWGPVVISRGRVYQPDRLGALVATRGDERVGLLTYRLEAGALEVLTLDAVEPGRGAGTALLHAAAETGRRAGARRLWLITSNDNLDALLFYLRSGLRLVSVHLDAVEQSRRLKPSIPVVGDYGIPVRDELELELQLGEPQAPPGS